MFLTSAMQNMSVKDEKRLPTDSLSAQMMEFFNENCQDTEFLKKKLAPLEDLTDAINKIYHGNEMVVTLLPFGSTVSGLGYKTSDIDAAIMWPRKRCKHRARRLAFIAKSLQQMQERGDLRIRDIEVITATVPVMKCSMYNEHLKQFVSVDLNMNNIDGLANSVLLRQYTIIDSRFQVLGLTIKKWAEVNGILDGSMGYLNSLSLMVLLVAFLQSVVQPPVLKNLQERFPALGSPGHPPSKSELLTMPRVQLAPYPNMQSVGELLIGFMRFYSRFDFLSQVVTINQGFLKASRRSVKERSLIMVRDPYSKKKLASSNIVSDKRFERIVSEFERAWKVLQGGGKLNELLKQE